MMNTGTLRVGAAVAATGSEAEGFVPEQPAISAIIKRPAKSRGLEVFMGKSNVLIRFAHDVVNSGVSSAAGEVRESRCLGFKLWAVSAGTVPTYRFHRRVA